MNDNNQYQEELKRDLETLRTGVSVEALEVLKRRYGFDKPIFGLEVMSSAEGNERFLRQALLKDGQRQVISFIQLAVTHE